MRFARALLVVLGLSGCDRGGGAEAAALRTEIQELRVKLVALEGRVATLEQQLTLERDARTRSEILARARESAPEPAKGPAESTEPPVLAPITCTAERCVVPRATFEAFNADPTLLVKAARVLPNLKEGQPAGFKLFGIRPGSPYAQIGLKNGDVVTAIGGLPVLDVEAAFKAMTELRSRTSWVIEGERAGAPLSITVALEG